MDSVGFGPGVTHTVRVKGVQSCSSSGIKDAGLSMSLTLLPDPETSSEPSQSQPCQKHASCNYHQSIILAKTSVNRPLAFRIW